MSSDESVICGESLVLGIWVGNVHVISHFPLFNLK